MSNAIYAYGWSGHILVSAADGLGDVDDNVVAVPEAVFRRLAGDCDHGEEHEGVEVKALGFDCREEGISVLATGTGFVRGFTHYGTIFTEAEDRVGGPMVADHDVAYLDAMRVIYGLELPPCRLMVGCSSEG